MRLLALFRRRVVSATSAPWHLTAEEKPQGPGQVIAFSAPANKEMRIGRKWVRRAPDVYTRWKEIA